MKNLNTFFSPKSIAVVGASPGKGKLGNVLIENIQKGGWKGKLYLVNPKYSSTRKEYFTGLKEIGRPVDLVLIAIPAKFVSSTLEEGANAIPAIKNFVIISSGFKEAGNEGRKLENTLRNIAIKYNLNILGPNCLGFANPYEKLNATFTDVKLNKGHIAIASQSGALAVALLDWAAEKNIGFSRIISIGNKTNIDENETIAHLARDKNTKVIALYLEDISNGQKFLEVSAGVSPRKPIVILKAGKTSAGQKAISSHTGSLAQDREIVDAVFEKLNLIQAENIEEFQDIIYYLNTNPLPKKKGVIVLTNAGGPGVMSADFIGKSSAIKLMDFSDDFKNELKIHLPASASVENPIDVIGDASPERYEKTLDKIARHHPDAPVLVILTPQNQTDPERVAQILGRYKKINPHVFSCFMGGEKIKSAKALLEKNNIPNFNNPESALSVIGRLLDYRFSQNGLIGKSARAFNVQPISGKNKIVQKVLLENRNTLFWDEAKNLFSAYGIRIAKSYPFSDIGDLKNTKVPFPCALKTDDPHIPHRWEKNAVRLNLLNHFDLEKAWIQMKKSTGARYFLVQSMAKTDLEMILGMKRDPVFGPIILCGWGGTFTEIINDKILFVPPINASEFEKKIGSMKIFPILKGYRGGTRYNLHEIKKILIGLSRMALENPEISEIDLNPCSIYAGSKSSQILDAKVFLSSKM